MPSICIHLRLRLHKSRPFTLRLIRFNWVSLIILAIAFTGCASSSAISTDAYKYTPVVRDNSGHLVADFLAKPNEIIHYHYGFRRTELEEINSDMNVSVKVFIERHRAIPPECTKGIRVAKIIAVENASLMTANIECGQE